LEHSLFQVFFSSNFSISLYYFLYVFIFFVYRSVRIIAKNPLILSNLLCLFPKKLLFLYFCIFCSNNPSWFIFCLSIFFPHSVFFFILPRHVQTSSQINQPNSSQTSYKKHIFSCTFGNFFREIKIPKLPHPVFTCFPIPGSSTKRERQSKEGELVNLLFALFLIHFSSVTSAYSRGREG